jgi:thiamine biosynthesis lipoprotein
MRLTFLLVLLFAFAKNGPAQDSTVVDFEHFQMGTQWKVIAFFPQGDLEEKEIEQDLIHLLDSLNTICSDYDPESELNKVVGLANEKKWVEVSPVLFDIIERSQFYSKQARGAFDISIGPLSRLWRRAFRRQVFPEGNQVEEARSKVNYRWIRIRKNALHLRRKGMRLDLGGIAKGYAVDVLCERLLTQGATSFLVDGGGDLRVLGGSPGKESWEVQLPNGEVKTIQSGAIATSGATYRYLIHKGKKYSHLIDPRTGYGVLGQRIVTVVAKEACSADAWASVFSILEGKQAEKLQEKWRPEIEVIIFE